MSGPIVIVGRTRKGVDGKRGTMDGGKREIRSSKE
jgi:hypothetical protein